MTETNSASWVIITGPSSCSSRYSRAFFLASSFVSV
ncbi:hypothetical protein vBEcoMWL3_gp210 [Escherichia phage vB_EcoM_WL-3]|nr:hypothetical protein vBEcoMWL3_gp210 [Escherichia phage vB_EcoM_WL-3]